MQKYLRMTCDCFIIMTTTADQMLLISGNTGSIFRRQQRPYFITLLSVNTLVCLERKEGPCDFIICSQRDPEQTS